MNDRQFYGLSENPFDVSADARFFFPSECHREALASLQYGIAYRKGFILMLGEAGIGKTTLIQQLVRTLDERTKVIHFPQSEIPFLQMLKSMLTQLNLTPEFETKGSMLHSLYYYLIDCLGRDEKVVVIIDETERISLALLEEVRLLANLETGTSKLLHLVLVGEPSLRKILHSDIVRQIEQRIVVSCSIGALTEKDSEGYIAHRLKIVGARTDSVFSPEALALICKSAKGVPLALNVLCSNALELGCYLGEKPVSLRTVRAVVHKKMLLGPKDIQALAEKITRRLSGKILLGLAACLVLVFAIWMIRHDRTSAGLPALSPQSAAMSDARTKKAELPAAPRKTAASPQQPPAVKEKIMEPQTQPVALPADKTTAAMPQRRILKEVQLQEGGNLSTLAMRHYEIANETIVDHILKLNPEISNPNLVLVSQKIKLPQMNEALLIVRRSERLYQIHLRTYGDAQSAEAYRKTARMWAGSLTIVPWIISDKETWYRVMAGPFISESASLAALDDMKKKGGALFPTREEKSWIMKAR